MTSHELIKKVKLSVTESRVSILNLFQEKNMLGFSIHDLLDHFEGQYDKVTLYRTINTFEKKGLIHKIIDESGLDKYALCGDDCTEQVHNHEHIHFYCLKCGKTECLNEHIELNIRLPLNYAKKHSNFLISGICGACNDQ